MAESDPDFEALLDAMKKAAGALRDAEVPFVLGGGLACWARGAPKTQEPGAAVGAREQDKDLERLLKDAAQGEDKAAQREISSAAAKEAVDRLNQIAQQLESQARLKQAAQALSQLQLAVAQRSLQA